MLNLNKFFLVIQSHLEHFGVVHYIYIRYVNDVKTKNKIYNLEHKSVQEEG